MNWNELIVLRNELIVLTLFFVAISVVISSIISENIYHRILCGLGIDECGYVFKATNPSFLLTPGCVIERIWHDEINRIHMSLKCINDDFCVDTTVEIVDGKIYHNFVKVQSFTEDMICG